MALDKRLNLGRHLFLPVLLFASLAGAQEAPDLARVRPVPAFALLVGNLVGELERERAEAIRYSAMRDSGKGFDLHPQWARSDAAVAALNEFLKKNGRHISPNVITTLDRARKDISAIERQRQSIEGFFVYNYQAYDFYSVIIDPLLGALAAVAEMPDPASKSIRIYSHAVQLQEAASRERDLIMQVIGGAGRKVSDRNLMAIITAEQAHTDTLMQLLNPDQKQFARIQLSGSFLDNLASLQTQAFTAAKTATFDQKLVSDWQHTQNQYLSRVLLVASRLGRDLQKEGTLGRGLQPLAVYAVPAAAVVALLVLLLFLRSRRTASAPAEAVAAAPPAPQVFGERPLLNPVPARPQEEVVFSGRPSVSLTLVPEGESSASTGLPVDEIAIQSAPLDLKDKIDTAVTSFQSAEDLLKFRKDEKP